MQAQPARSDKGKPGFGSLGCLISVAVIGLLCVFVYYGQQAKSFRDLEAKLAHDRQTQFADVKQGGATVQLMLDTRLLAQLAGDVDCVRNLREIIFIEVELTPADAMQVAKLKQLQSLGFYSSHGADFVLEQAGQLPVEKVWFEVSRVSDDTLRKLGAYPSLKEVHFEQVISPEQELIIKSWPPSIKVRMPFLSRHEP